MQFVRGEKIKRLNMMGENRAGFMSDEQRPFCLR